MLAHVTFDVVMRRWPFADIRSEVRLPLQLVSQKLNGSCVQVRVCAVWYIVTDVMFVVSFLVTRSHFNFFFVRFLDNSGLGKQFGWDIKACVDLDGWQFPLEPRVITEGLTSVPLLLVQGTGFRVWKASFLSVDDSAFLVCFSVPCCNWVAASCFTTSTFFAECICCICV